MFNDRGRALPAIRTVTALLGLAAAVWARPAGPDSMALLLSPRFPVPGKPLRILAAGRAPLENIRIQVQGPAGKISAVKARAAGGPPFWWSAEFPLQAEGDYRVSVTAEGKTLAASAFRVTSGKSPAMIGTASGSTF